jgi:hypothetical protein
MKKTIFVFCIAVIGVIISCRTMKDNSSGIEIPFVFEHGRIIVDVTINGQTGKYSWIIMNIMSDLKDIDPDWPVVRKAGIINFGPQNHYRINVLTIGGIPVRARSIALRSAEFDGSAQDYFALYGLDGTLCVDVFSGYWCEVSFSKKKIILYSEKPSHYNQSISGTFSSDSLLTVPVTIDGIKYDFFIANMPLKILETMTAPYTMLEQEPGYKYKKFTTTEGDYYWVRTEEFNIFGETFFNKTIMTDFELSTIFAELGNDDYGKRTGALNWNYLQNYDLLFDFTKLPIENYQETPTEVYYAPRNLPEDRERLFVTEYPGGELGAFAFIDPSGVTLFLAEDSPLSDLGITVNTVITHIDGKPVSTMAEAGMVEFTYRTVLTVLDENGKEQETGLARLRP